MSIEGAERRSPAWRRILVLPPVLIGVALLVVQLRVDRGPDVPEAVERVAAADVMVVVPATVVPRAVGYGTVEPARTLRATAEIAGRLIDRHPQMERGRLLPAGTLVARIERADYELAEVRARAEIQRLEALIQQLDVRRANLERSLAIDVRAARLAEADLERQQALRERGNTSAASVDEAETALLAQRDQVQAVRSSLAELDPEIAVREADLAMRRAELRQAELDLERTEIYLPFDARVADVQVEVGEYVQPGTVLASFDGIARAEIDAQFALSQIRRLIPEELSLPALDLTTLRALPERLGLEATIRLREQDVDVTWRARFERPSDRIDAQTRTLGLIVAVDDPYGQAVPGRRPPLTKGMFVEVELRGRPLTDQLVVPIQAVHDPGGAPFVLIVDPDDRLRRRAVKVASVTGDFVRIEAGLASGDRVVLTNLRPAVDGMRLAPTTVSAPSTTTLTEARR